MIQSKCPRCGCTGIHACMGAPAQPMTTQQLAELERAITSIIELEKKGKETMVLTKKQIGMLATYAGFNIQDISGTESSTEFEVRNGTITSDVDSEEYNGLIAYTKDYPEDGAVPLE